MYSYVMWGMGGGGNVDVLLLSFLLSFTIIFLTQVDGFMFDPAALKTVDFEKIAGVQVNSEMQFECCGSRLLLRPLNRADLKCGESQKLWKERLIRVT